jgi:hypothetical protein
MSTLTYTNIELEADIGGWEDDVKGVVRFETKAPTNIKSEVYAEAFEYAIFHAFVLVKARKTMQFNKNKKLHIFDVQKMISDGKLPLTAFQARVMCDMMVPILSHITKQTIKPDYTLLHRKGKMTFVFP